MKNVGPKPAPPTNHPTGRHRQETEQYATDNIYSSFVQILMCVLEFECVCVCVYLCSYRVTEIFAFKLSFDERVFGRSSRHPERSLDSCGLCMQIEFTIHHSEWDIYLLGSRVKLRPRRLEAMKSCDLMGFLLAVMSLAGRYVQRKSASGDKVRYK